MGLMYLEPQVLQATRSAIIPGLMADSWTGLLLASERSKLMVTIGEGLPFFRFT
jgi:hypothetical protein